MQGIWLAAICSLLSSLFSLLSSVPPEDAESARPWRLHMRDGFLRRNHDPPLKCSDSSPQQTLLQYSCSAIVHYLIASNPLPTASTLCGTILGPNETPPTNPVSQLLLFKKLHLRISGCLFVISSLFSLLASLAAAHFSERSSHFSLRTFHQAIDSAANSFDFWRQLSKAELLPSSALSS